MKKINFSHNYWKFPFDVRIKNNKEVTLIQALKINYKDLSKEMIIYDARYSEKGIYDIPKTDLILLIFKTKRENEIFTTIRRFAEGKWKYYKSSEGEKFEVVMKA